MKFVFKKVLIAVSFRDIVVAMSKMHIFVSAIHMSTWP